MIVATESLDVGHIVQFYGHDGELADQVAGYLQDALDGDGVAVVIATAAHRSAFEAQLRQAGADVDAAIESGRYVALDASKTMRAFMPDGRLDADGFEDVIGGLIRRVSQGGRPVRAYGEMVALLWDAGLVDTAIQLEEMWESLGRRLSFSLFCGYPASSVTRDGHLDAFAEVCRLHREIVGSSQAVAAPPGGVRAFTRSIASVAAARHFAVDALRRLGAGDLADDAALVVTELAANAVIHAHSRFWLDLALGQDALRISVRDTSPLPAAAAAAPRPATPLPAAPLHGLGAVNALAKRWGVEPLGQAGKAVWVELRR